MKTKCNSPQTTNGLQVSPEFTQSKIAQGFLRTSQLLASENQHPPHHLIYTSEYTLSCRPAPGSVLLNLHSAHYVPMCLGNPCGQNCFLLRWLTIQLA